MPGLITVLGIRLPYVVNIYVLLSSGLLLYGQPSRLPSTMAHYGCDHLTSLWSRRWATPTWTVFSRYISFPLSYASFIPSLLYLHGFPDGNFDNYVTYVSAYVAKLVAIRILVMAILHRDVHNRTTIIMLSAAPLKNDPNCLKSPSSESTHLDLEGALTSEGQLPDPGDTGFEIDLRDHDASAYEQCEVSGTPPMCVNSSLFQA
jgi:hypothetical protein